MDVVVTGTTKGANFEAASFVRRSGLRMEDGLWDERKPRANAPFSLEGLAAADADGLGSSTPDDFSSLPRRKDGFGSLARMLRPTLLGASIIVLPRALAPPLDLVSIPWEDLFVSHFMNMNSAPYWLRTVAHAAPAAPPSHGWAFRTRIMSARRLIAAAAARTSSGLLTSFIPRHPDWAVPMTTAAGIPRLRMRTYRSAAPKT
mmetsp:Transcript_27069/g.64260  ORF Transcript_27069/g.64260 Transcript_27069/m.64260 type:complete len:203 (+) Transcript_27069:794-1402(+)